jgi:hypothetical protein
MRVIRLTSNLRTTHELVSGILNLICPECGGRMGERGKEFNARASVGGIGGALGSVSVEVVAISRDI